MTLSEPTIEKGVRSINTLPFPLQSPASGGEKRLLDDPTIVELFTAILLQLTPEQCGCILTDVGHEIIDQDVDVKKYLAMLFVENLNAGYKEYLLLEKEMAKQWFE